MVGAAVAVKKLWKSLRTSVTVKGRGMKRKLASINLLKKKKKRLRNGRNIQSSIPTSNGRMDRFDHYNYSDDDEMDSRFQKKLRNCKFSALACVLGKGDTKPENQFVYVMDLYASTSSKMASCSDQDVKVDQVKAEKIANCNASSSSATDVDMTSENETIKSMDSQVQMDMKTSSSAEKKVEVDTEISSSCATKSAESVCWSYQAELRVEQKKDGKSVCRSADTEEVDTEAEVFIAKFYDQMRLQRQKSIVEYREMLERGTI
eukprot:Gb_29412 [translate_table: standard]